MNGDDQPALGAAYHFASLSAGFKIKKVELIDGPNYELHYEIKGKDNNKDIKEL